MAHELSILNYLGGKKLLGIKDLTRPLAFHDIVSTGLPAASLMQFKERLGLTNTEVSVVIGVSEKTLVRWGHTPKKLMDPVASDRLYRAAKVMALAREVFEDDEEARGWMSEPQIALGDKVPLELLTSDAGAHQVEELLLRMEHGYLA